MKAWQCLDCDSIGVLSRTGCCATCGSQGVTTSILKEKSTMLTQHLTEAKVSLLQAKERAELFHFSERVIANIQLAMLVITKTEVIVRSEMDDAQKKKEAEVRTTTDGSEV